MEPQDLLSQVHVKAHHKAVETKCINFVLGAKAHGMVGFGSLPSSWGLSPGLWLNVGFSVPFVQSPHMHISLYHKTLVT